MKKEIIVNAGDLESRVAILEEGTLAELHVEREPRIVGNIYKGRVEAVLPGMDAAFADLGLERNAFLCADDVSFTRDQDGASRPEGKPSRGKEEGRRGREMSYAPIAQKLKVGQEVLVQISRAPVGSKGARATTRLSLPGRYLVLMIGDSRRVGVSRRIEEEKERERLRRLGEALCPADCGLILRTEAEGENKGELKRDLDVLLELRRRVEEKAKRSKAPATIHEDLTLTRQIVRDSFTEEVDRLLIDSESAYQNALELLSLSAPKLRKRVQLYREPRPIFAKFGLEEEIDRLLRRRVWLAAGGYISIDQAEAFAAIDVNTGRYTGSRGLADTILRTNLEAATEIARQLRLRDLGGIIVIDFIDMERADHRAKVVAALEKGLTRDRQKTKILNLSRLGLVEMTRKRRGESLLGLLSEICPECAGIGRVRSPLTIALRIERELLEQALEKKAEALLVEAHPRVAALLLGPAGARARSTEQRAGRPIYLRSDDSLRHEEYRLRAAKLSELPSLISLFHRGDRVEARILLPEEALAGEGPAAVANGYWIFLPEGDFSPGDTVSVTLTSAGTSFGEGGIGSAPPREPSKDATPPPRRRPSSRRRRRGARPATPSAEPERAPSTGRPPTPPPTAEKPAPRPEQRAATAEKPSPEPTSKVAGERPTPESPPPAAAEQAAGPAPSARRKTRWVRRSPRSKPGHKSAP